jgi:hypothetical protein
MRYLFIAILAVSGLPGAAAAQKKPAEVPVPPVFNRVVACSAIADSAQRLACYDKEVPAMATAQRSGDLVAMDKAQVRKTRRSLFGLALPDLGIFGDDSDDAVASIETKIKSLRTDPRGRYIFDLVEGGRWEALESRTFIVDPAPGQTIKIRRAALGSYLANVNNQIAIRVRRVN